MRRRGARRERFALHGPQAAAPHRQGGPAVEARLKRELEGKGRPLPARCPAPRATSSSAKVLLEAKSTTQESMAVKLAWLLKIARRRARKARARRSPCPLSTRKGRPGWTANG